MAEQLCLIDRGASNEKWMKKAKQVVRQTGEKEEKGHVCVYYYSIYLCLWRQEGIVDVCVWQEEERREDKRQEAVNCEAEMIIEALTMNR